MKNEQTEAEYVSEITLAERTTMTRAFWQTLRARGKGPAFYKIGRRCLYKWHEVQAWLEGQRVEPKKAS
jgi:hypothetical protein